jgi:hypothetical protein
MMSSGLGATGSGGWCSVLLVVRERQHAPEQGRAVRCDPAELADRQEVVEYATLSPEQEDYL